MPNFISYTIQPTDSIRSIAERFGVPLNELVELNPQVCTAGKQEGLVLNIPITDANLNVIRLYSILLAYYFEDTPNVFSMLYALVKKVASSKEDLEKRFEKAGLYFQNDISAALEPLGVSWDPTGKDRTLKEERKAEIYAITKAFNKL
jgi:LysM repeat protein